MNLLLQRMGWTKVLMKGVATLLGCLLLLGCGGVSEEDKLEDAYLEGWYSALDCVKSEGGSARDAANECR